MSVSEFRDLVSAVSTKINSVKSAALPDEKERELCGLQNWIRELREAQWPKRLSDDDRAKARKTWDRANELLAGAT